MIYCPDCGSELLFDSASQMMVCGYCKNRFDPYKLKDNLSNDAKTQVFFDSYAYICPSCGAEIDTADKNDAVGFCPYCKGSSMIFDKLRRDWTPEGIVPFMITKEQCKQLYCAQVKKYFFVSGKFKNPDLIEEFRGIYMPYCRFRGEVDGPVSLRAEGSEVDIGNYYYRTDYYDLKGTARYTITEKIAHDASAAFDDHISERLGDFDERQMKSFNPAYLSGYYAESGNADMNEYLSLTHDEMQPFICEHMKNDIAVKTVSDGLKLTIDPSHAENSVPIHMVTSNRRLFPVWFMSYRRGEKITYAAVNGQTGKVAADLPLSPVKILVTAFIISAVIFGLLMFGMNYLPTIPASATLGVCTMLGFAGMYVLQHCYIRTIGVALHQKEMTKKLPAGFFVQSIIAAASIILITTDGTYEKYRYLAGIVLGVISFGSLLLGYLLSQSTLTGKIKKIQLKGESMRSNGILMSARKFNRINALMRTVMLISLIAVIPFIILNDKSNMFYYGLAVVEAAELFALTIMHIMFQSSIASRRLPQFNKKGAAYDKI